MQLAEVSIRRPVLATVLSLLIVLVGWLHMATPLLSVLFSCFVLGNPLLPVYRGEIQCAGLGMAVDVFDEGGAPIRGAKGELVCTRPFPSMPLGFWNDEDGARYHAAYFSRFPGVWAHGDYAEITPHNGMIIHGRSDATLNPGGVRIGTAEIYRQVEQLPEILESIVIGQDWQGDVRVVLFVRLKAGETLSDDLVKRIKAQILGAFYIDTDMWRGMVLGQSLMAVRQAINGLNRANTV